MQEAVRPRTGGLTARRSGRSSSSGGRLGGPLPRLPRRRAALLELLETTQVLERVHRDPEAVVPKGHQLVFRDQSREGLVDEILVLADVVEDLAPEDVVAAVDPQPGLAGFDDPGNVAVLAVADDVERILRSCREQGADLAAGPECLDEHIKRRVRDDVAVVGEEHLLVLDVRPDSTKTTTDERPRSGVGERDPPVADVGPEVLDLVAVGQDEVVRDGLVVVQEVVLDRIGPVAEAEDEVTVAVVGVVAHDVPQDRPVADPGHGLGQTVGMLAEPQPLATAEEDDLHALRRAPRPSGWGRRAASRGPEAARAALRSRREGSTAGSRRCRGGHRRAPRMDGSGCASRA